MKKTTLLDIAKAVNVSKTTVSMVLNNKENNISKDTKEKIFKVAKELNYIPNYLAKSLITKKSYSIGVLVPDIQNPFFNEMIKGMEKIAEENGYSIILCNTLNSKKREAQHIRLLMSKAVDGLIIAPIDDKSDSFKLLESQGIPFVIVDRLVENFENFNGVFCDNVKGISLGMEYLYNKNKRKIAFIGGNKNLITANIRLETYVKKANEFGIYNKELNIEEDFSLEGGFKATEKLMIKNLNIDAIFYGSDIMAIGGIKYLIRNGYKIPQDISILGFDNIDICKFIEPELTTIAQPIYNIGEEGIKLLIDLINKKNVKKKIIKLEPYLIERFTINR